MCKLLSKYSKIHNTILGSGYYIRGRDGLIFNSTVPMNDLYWISGNLREVEFDNFKYMEYEDINMMRIKKFKKGK